MILKAYSIRDIHSGFSVPTFEYNEAIAIRQFQNAVMSTSGVLKSHKSDFSLYEIGSFNTDTAEFTPFTGSSFRLLIDGADVEV